MLLLLFSADYIWTNMSCSQAEVTLQMSPAGYSYSDHFAVRARLLPRSSSAAGSKAMKLGAAAAAAGSDASSASQQQQQRAEGSSMPIPKQIATVMASAMLLEEGIQSFTGSSYTLSTLGAFMLTSVVYSAVALPLLMPELVFRGLLLISPLMIGTGALSLSGLVLFLIGQVADKSQKRALQNAFRLLKVWMQQEGIEPTAAVAGAAAGAPAACGVAAARPQ
eukprot:GHUV01012358.1.p2 GENE.GHUV01012358.1~~GHUV01012358.1.p2  ORF type:complete len:222 (+),score=52.43 GHUV01012358.1:646-1311(+)